MIMNFVRINIVKLAILSNIIYRLIVALIKILIFYRNRKKKNPRICVEA